MYSGPVKLELQGGGIPNVFQKKEYVVLKSTQLKLPPDPKYTSPKIAHQSNLAPIENQFVNLI